MKRILYIFGILFMWSSLLIASEPATKEYRIKKVVIDAGHGGHDPGALGKKSREKDITLIVALKLGEYIKKNMPDVQVIYTRDTDVFVELFKRAKIANDNNADLFISIHCNANKSPVPYGAETFVMGMHKTEANLEVAKKENAAILMEDNYENQYDGFDLNSPESMIIFQLFQNAHIDQSLKIASKIQTQFKSELSRTDRGVKQAGFLVLYKTKMPSILVELGFLSNPQEEEYLFSAQGQEELSLALFKSFKSYRNEVEGRGNEIAPIDPTPSVTTPAPAKNTSELVFKVQFAVSKTLMPLTDPAFAGLDKISYYQHNNLYKYTVGEEKEFKVATEYQKELKKKGFKEAFVIAFYKGERIPMDEALQLLDK